MFFIWWRWKFSISKYFSHNCISITHKTFFYHRNLIISKFRIRIINNVVESYSPICRSKAISIKISFTAIEQHAPYLVSPSYPILSCPIRANPLLLQRNRKFEFKLHHALQNFERFQIIKTSVIFHSNRATRSLPIPIRVILLEN